MVTVVHISRGGSMTQETYEQISAEMGTEQDARWHFWRHLEHANAENTVGIEPHFESQALGPEFSTRQQHTIPRLAAHRSSQAPA